MKTKENEPTGLLTERECVWQLLLALSTEHDPKRSAYLLQGLMDVYDEALSGRKAYARP